MAVPRIEWQCPGCQRKFAIPDQYPRPKLCPNCQQASAAQQTRPSAPSAAPPANETEDSSLDFEEEESFEAAPSPRIPLSAAQSPPNRRPVKQRRYEVLRTISMWFKILAGLLAVVYIVTLIGLGILVVRTPPGLGQTWLFFYWIVTSITGITLVLIIYAFAVLLLVAMDIEYNTREE